LPNQNNAQRIQMMQNDGVKNLVKFKAFLKAKNFFLNYFAVNEIDSKDEQETYEKAKFLLDINSKEYTMQKVKENLEKLPKFLAPIFKLNTNEELKIGEFIIKMYDLFEILNKHKNFFYYLYDKDMGYFEILSNQIDFSQAKMEPTVINEIRAAKSKIDNLFEKKQNFDKNQQKTYRRFSLKSLYDKIFTKSGIDQDFINDLTNDFKKLYPFYEC